MDNNNNIENNQQREHQQREHQQREHRDPNQQRDYREQREQRSPMRMRKRRKVCAFCTEKLENIDYKDIPRLRKFLSERSKILPRRITGNCAKHQRLLTIAVKRARYIALIPYVSD